jgi:hypothetical protein
MTRKRKRRGFLMPHRHECPIRAASHATNVAVLMLKLLREEQHPDSSRPSDLIADAREELHNAEKWLNSAARPPR